MAFNTMLLTPYHSSTVYKTMIPAILEILYHKLGYELDSSLLERYGACMDYTAEAERKHIMRDLYYVIDDAATGLGITKIHNVTSVHGVHYRIHWS